MSQTQKRRQPHPSNKQPAQPKPPKLDALAQINHHAAGLDIGDAEIYAAVPESAADPAVRVFRTFTPDLEALADWLTSCHVDTVAMESTGVYWIPIYDLLEARGFQVYLVNARQLKNVSGKKTDILDCQWIQQLHTYGLLQPSFRPPEEICALRALVRQRGRLIQSCSTEIQHMQKALQQMNLKLTQVLSDIAGVTGLQIIRAMVAGARTPHTLAAYRDTHCRKSEAEIAAALTGHYQAEHVFALRPALAGYDFPNPSLRCGDRPDLPNGAPSQYAHGAAFSAAAAGAQYAPPRTGLRSAQRVVSPGRCRPARCDGPRRRDGAGRADRDWRRPEPLAERQAFHLVAGPVSRER